MDRTDLQRLTKEELIDLVLRMQRPEKTSRTSSKPPSSDRKERRDKAKPGGAKPGHEGHSRAMSEDFDCIVDHHPDQCPCCRASLPRDLPAEAVSEHDKIELPAIKPLIERHRRLAVRCPSCGTLVVAALPDAAKGTPFGPRVHAVATYLKTFQALSYERLQGAFADLFGLTVSQGGLMNMLRRAQGVFIAERDSAVAALRQAKVIASDETGVRIEGSNAYHWVFRCAQAVVHQAAPTRGAVVVRTVMDGHRPDVWCSDRYAAQQGHATAHQTWRIWPAMSPMPTRQVRTCCLRGSSFGCKEPSPWLTVSKPSQPRPSQPSAAPWSEVWMISWPHRHRAIWPAISRTSSGEPAISF